MMQLSTSPPRGGWKRIVLDHKFKFWWCDFVRRLKLTRALMGVLTIKNKNEVKALLRRVWREDV